MELEIRCARGAGCDATCAPRLRPLARLRLRRRAGSAAGPDRSMRFNNNRKKTKHVRVRDADG